MPTIAGELASPPQHEWLSVIDYLNGPGTAPVWFVADPQRTDVDLIGHDDPTAYRWSLPYPVLMSGVRPDEMDWYRLDSPRWYLGEGWALTPESAGVSTAEQPASAPLHAWIGDAVFGETIAIGGRNLGGHPATVDIDSTRGHIATVTAAPGFFAQLVAVPMLGRTGPRPFERLDIRVAPRSAIALEQFNASDRDHPILAFGDGWQEQEYNPGTGLRWRWVSDHGDLLVSPSHSPMLLKVEGESPRKYFGRGSRVVVRAGSRVVFDETLSNDFSLTIPIDDSSGLIRLETDQTFVPAERRLQRTLDRRRLGLRIYRCQVRRLIAPVSGPGK